MKPFHREIVKTSTKWNETEHNVNETSDVFPKKTIVLNENVEKTMKII